LKSSEEKPPERRLAVVVMDGGQQFDLESCHEGYALMSLDFRSPPWRRLGKPFRGIGQAEHEKMAPSPGAPETKNRN